MDAQCDKLATVVGRQFITLSVHLCVQHYGADAVGGAGLCRAAETCNNGYEWTALEYTPQWTSVLSMLNTEVHEYTHTRGVDAPSILAGSQLTSGVGLGLRQCVGREC